MTSMVTVHVRVTHEIPVSRRERTNYGHHSSCHAPKSERFMELAVYEVFHCIGNAYYACINYTAMSVVST